MQYSTYSEHMVRNTHCGIASLYSIASLKILSCYNVHILYALKSTVHGSVVALEHSQTACV